MSKGKRRKQRKWRKRRGGSGGGQGGGNGNPSEPGGSGERPRRGKPFPIAQDMIFLSQKVQGGMVPFTIGSKDGGLDAALLFSSRDEFLAFAQQDELRAHKDLMVYECKSWEDVRNKAQQFSDAGVELVVFDLGARLKGTTQAVALAEVIEELDRILSGWHDTCETCGKLVLFECLCG